MGGLKGQVSSWMLPGALNWCLLLIKSFDICFVLESGSWWDYIIMDQILKCKGFELNLGEYVFEQDLLVQKLGYILCTL